MNQLDLAIKVNEIFEAVKQYMFMQRIVKPITEGKTVHVLDVEQLVQDFDDVSIIPILVTDNHTIFIVYTCEGLDEDTYVLENGVVSSYTYYEDALELVESFPIQYIDLEYLGNYMGENSWKIVSNTIKKNR